jgi:ParB-like chromosome segregation protein Spo0J
MPMPKKISVRYLSLDKIKPNPTNPRNITDAIQPVANSIKEFGFLNPIVINKDSTVLAGHVRLEAAKLLGLTEVPTVSAKDLTPEQQKAFLVADNKTSDNATFDTAKLTDIFSDLSELEFDLESTGFGVEEIDSLLSSATDELTDLFNDEDEPTGGPDKPTTGRKDNQEGKDPSGKLKQAKFLLTPDQNDRIFEAIRHAQKEVNLDMSNSEGLFEVCDFYLRSAGE